MSTKTNDRSKEMAAKIAAMLASPSPDRDAIAEMLTGMGYKNETGKVSDSYEDDFDFEGNVGIYSPVTQTDGSVRFERDPRCKERWSYYADVQVIPARSNKKRVVLLGESVARGFLLDPDFTPAYMMQSLLGVNSGKDNYEVIDLAETNLGMAGIRRRFDQCMLLQPDIIVFLAGNNWRTDLQVHIENDAESYEQLHKALTGGNGIEAVKPVVENFFALIVKKFIHEVGEIAGQKKIPVLFVIPEFNLGDCQSTPGERFVSALPGRMIEQWIEAREDALKAAEAGKWDDLGVAARKMIELDVTHPLGYEYLAKSRQNENQPEERRNNLELARDTALFCRTNSKPRIFEVIKRVMREEFPANGIQFIDIGEVFKGKLGGAVPDKRFFLDYCHFTVEGIQTAMSAVASKVLEIISGTGVASLIHPKAIAPDKDTYAYSHLFAAIHNAHWGQPYPVLEYHASRALSYSRDISNVMINYCEMMTRAASNNLCKSFETLIKDKRMDKYVHTLIHPRNQKTMELDLVDAMVKALRRIGIQMETVIGEMRIKEHGVQDKKLNLLHPCYHSTSYDEYQGTKTAFYQSRDNRSRFFLVAKPGTKVTLSLTLRIKEMQYDNPVVKITCGDGFESAITASGKWDDYTIVIPGKHITQAVNYIDITWPWQFELLRTGDEEILQSSHTAQNLLDASFFVFGEIIRFGAEGQATENSTEVPRAGKKDTAVIA